MNTKHTPGPWEAVGNLVRSPMTKECGMGVMLAECSDRYFQKENSDEAKANARLIASAPELLEALEMAMQIGDQCSRGFLSQFHDKARAAITKATGG